MNSSVSLTAIVLTYNEEIHLERCLSSLLNVCRDVVVVDSFSSDSTRKIAEKFGARFFENPWTNHATQINWAINNTSISTDWVIRVDADEYLSKELQTNLLHNLSKFSADIHGVRIKRLMYFFDKPLKKSGMYPIWHLKIWRNGSAHCEQRWMDERIKLSHGSTATMEGDLIDYNLNNLTWWTAKHNGYATREAIDILDKIYGFTSSENMQGKLLGTSEEKRRWLKERYLKLPLFVRPFIFFIIRYFFQGGFLEGKTGFMWNILQCFWYRFLVDAKIFEAYFKAGKNKESLIRFFKEEYGYDVTKVG